MVGALVVAASAVAGSAAALRSRDEIRPGGAAAAVGGAPGAGRSARTDAASSATAAPRRLVSLVPSITETLFALGIGDRVVGVSASCDFPASVKTLPKVGTFTAPVAEAIVALTPDLVLTSPSPGNHSAVRALQRAGVRVEVVYGDGGIAEARQGMAVVADAVGEGTRGRELIARIDAELAAVRAAVAGLQRPRVAVAVGREPLILAGPASYLGELLALAGGTNIADAVGGRWPQVGLEFLVQQRPEVIIDLSISMNSPVFAGDPSDEMSLDSIAVKAWERLSSVPAVVRGRVYGSSDPQASGAEPDALLRPGPRLGETARLLAARLHPARPGPERER